MCFVWNGERVAWLFDGWIILLECFIKEKIGSMMRENGKMMPMIGWKIPHKFIGHILVKNKCSIRVYELENLVLFFVIQIYAIMFCIYMFPMN